MTFNDVIHLVFSEIQQHMLKVAVGFVLMGLGWYFGHWRARKNWKKREFLDRLNFSLNWIENGTLKLRTLAEKSCEDVFLNQTATDEVLRSARKTTESNPILPLHDRDYWYYLNSVLNELSEQFAVGHIRKAQGQPVSTAVYLLCLTCEASADVRMKKVRAMVIQKSLLLNLPENEPTFEKSHHKIRWLTLQTMAAEYQKHPNRFLELELSV